VPSSAQQERPSIRDVARKVGVSVSTVSRVLNARPDVAPATRERVLQAIAELNYHPNAQAVGLSRRSTGVIALVVPDVISPFCTSMIESVQNNLRERGYWLLLAAYGVFTEDRSRQARLIEELGRSRRIDGLLVLTPLENSLRPLRELARDGLPSVLIDMQYDGTDLNYITVNNYRGGYLAAEHLLRLGYREIATLCGPLWMHVSQDRLEGYQAALRDWGAPIYPEWIVPVQNFDEESGGHGMRTLLAADRRPRAIFAASDRIAFGAIGTLDRVGLRVPEDVAIVGFDDIPVAANFRPPLTTVRQPLEYMGQLAVEYLDGLLIGKIDGHQFLQATIETEIIVRVSCGIDKSQSL
jgi:LacI family transcriptional regulator